LCVGEPDCAAALLHALPQLCCFGLGLPEVSEELLAAVAATTQLTALMLWGNEELPSLQALTALSLLQRLVLAEQLSSDEGLQPPTPLRRYFPNLRYFVFGVCGLAGDYALVKVRSERVVKLVVHAW